MTTDTKADRRERIATAALAAIIGKAPLIDYASTDAMKDDARRRAIGATVYADALIAELDARAAEEVPTPAPKAQEPPQSAKTDTCDDYPANVLAACPWAKRADLELIECGHDEGNGKWLWFVNGRKSFYHTKDRVWKPRGTSSVELPHEPSGMFGSYPTRESALKSPPPPPPGYVEPKPEPASSTLDRLAEVAFNETHGSSGATWDRCLQRYWLRVAHAVRMAVLMEGPSEEEIAAAWSHYSFSSKDRIGAMKVALYAARQARIDAAKKEKP